MYSKRKDELGMCLTVLLRQLQNSGVVEQSSYIVEVSDGLSLPSKLVTGFYNHLYIPQVDSFGYPTSRLVR